MWFKEKIFYEKLNNEIIGSFLLFYVFGILCEFKISELENGNSVSKPDKVSFTIIYCEYQSLNEHFIKRPILGKKNTASLSCCPPKQLVKRAIVHPQTRVKKMSNP